MSGGGGGGGGFGFMPSTPLLPKHFASALGALIDRHKAALSVGGMPDMHVVRYSMHQS